MFSAKDYVYEVYREKSFTLAAKKLFVSQPALSASIKKTEKLLGTELFERSSSPVRLTEAGQAYIEAVEQIYAVEENLKNKIYDINNLKTGKITVGAANFISSSLIPEIISDFTEKFPGITLDLIESNSEDLKEKSLEGKIDVIIDYDFDDKFFNATAIKEEHIYLSASKNSEVAKRLKDYALTAGDIKRGRAKTKPAVTLHDIADEKFILLKKGNDMYKRAVHIFKEAEIHPEVALNLDQLMTSFTLSAKGLGIAFVTDTLISTSETDSAVFFKLNSGYAKRTIQIAHKRAMYVSKRLSVFISTAAESCKKL